MAFVQFKFFLQGLCFQPLFFIFLGVFACHLFDITFWQNCWWYKVPSTSVSKLMLMKYKLVPKRLQTLTESKTRRNAFRGCKKIFAQIWSCFPK